MKGLPPANGCEMALDMVVGGSMKIPLDDYMKSSCFLTLYEFVLAEFFDTTYHDMIH